MSDVKMLHNPRCSKSRQTLELLNDKGLNPEITEYLVTPLSLDEINAIATKLELKPSQFVRKNEYGKLGIEMAETEDGIARQMAEYPILIERPIVIKGDKARIGRPPESVLNIL